MTIRKHANNIETTLNGSITNVATTIVVTSATGFPTIGSGEVFYLTITDGSNTEIVEVTDDASSPSFTVVRGKEGTSGTAFADLSTVELRETANSFDRKQDQVATATEVIDFGAATSFEIPNSAAPSLTAVGQVALDTTVTDYTDGLVTYYSGTTEYAVIAIPKTALATPTDDYVVTYDATTDLFKLAAAGGGGGSGDVVGPGSATSSGVALFDGTTGKLLKDGAGVNASINTLSITLGATQVATNQGFGVSALAVSNGSSNNTIAVGYEAGKAVTSAVQGTYIGSQAGLAITTGGQSVYIGYQAGKTVTTGSGNVHLGTLAGSLSGVNRSNNTYIGFNAGKYIDASSNVFVGANAGSGSGAATTSDSVVVGYNAMANTTTSTTGYGLAIIGAGSCAALTTANFTSVFGYNSFTSLTTGINNSGFGVGVGIAGATGAVALTTGAGNTLLGSRAGTSAADCANAIALGRDAVATKATGATSGDFGPGISLGSAAFPVGFRGDGSIIPSSSGGAGFLKSKINGAQYYVPLFADGATSISSVIAANSFSAQRSATQTLTRLTYTKLQCDTENWDTGSYYDNATNYRYQPTVAGKYTFTGTVAFLSLSSGNNAIAALALNGSNIAFNAQILSASGSPYLQVSATIDMNGSTDYVELRAYHDNAVDRNAAATDTKLVGWRIE